MPNRNTYDIAFFGSSLVSAYWNGAATYYRGILQALHKRGHTVTFYEPDAFDRQSHRDIANPAYARVVVYGAKNEFQVIAAIQQAQTAQVVVKASGVGVYDELLEEAVLGLRKPATRVVFWDVDAPATLERMRTNRSDRFRELVRAYDGVFTYGGGEPVIQDYTDFGARTCVPIYNALDPTTHYPVSPRDEYRADLSLLANRMPDREKRIHEFFFRPAAALPRHRFLLGGNGWGENAPRRPNIAYIGHVYTADHNAFNSSARAVLNVNRQSMADYGFSPATRIFEAAGAGACIITDSWRGIDRFLTPGQECLVAETGEDVASILQNLSPERAAAIGTAAYHRVQAEHTYDHRALLVEEKLCNLFEVN
ncbi:MAG: glycosyltransferase [Chitinivibrionales bacterium]|nr:glycosyltransferase [Chitinivibrionales bacterium]MBD3358787.1 glycosyltransferase [Chitinivibrionales bacterium]